ncbi:DUF3616 domain-containing protein [Synechococcus sp. BO 8801]|uniref:DUF3616 domain-containing protein n=1 Tax=Synechococcus sp. BO 8801 TaxID=169670 RepID=UPI000B989289|nr:DUF3616 domain-containing protein [Synechococcus sp. BO 8801]
MALTEADLPLASSAVQRVLELGVSGDKDQEKFLGNLSALASRNGDLWLGGDEGNSLYQLKDVGEEHYGDPIEVDLKDYGLADGDDDEDGESDIEGLAFDGDRLWLVGSHSLRRRKHDENENPLRLYSKKKQSTNAHVLGCLRLDENGQPVAGQRLAFDSEARCDALTHALEDDPLISPFLSTPSKENGLDIEGIAARGSRVLVGLRGPILRGIALVLDLQMGGLDGDGPTLTLDDHHVRYLSIGGLAVRDLAVVPGSDDVLILAGPTMTQVGPCFIYRWGKALSAARKEPDPDVITLETVEPLLWIRDGRSGKAKEGSDKPEGLEVQPHGGRLLAWVAYDDPTKARRKGKGARTRLDGFVLPE